MPVMLRVYAADAIAGTLELLANSELVVIVAIEILLKTTQASCQLTSARTTLVFVRADQCDLVLSDLPWTPSVHAADETRSYPRGIMLTAPRRFASKLLAGGTNMLT
jgi:hypothetical protein